ncbi:MAG: T9SS type A sorting domain-containing protein, partial [Bacteroidales bacterium]|nr:T9SS type A sorting domain-containing protein [Bacteroidales bacterium]
WFSTGNPGGFSSLQGIVKDFYPKQDEYPYYCSGTKILTSKSGRVNDGSGPINNYLTGTDAGWLIQPQGEYDSVVNITLSWESFDVATGDVVKIYDGTDQNATLIGEYSGNTLPETFTSSGNTLFIKFNSTNEAPGFTFVYTTTRPTYCSGTTHITEPAVIRPAPEGKYYNPSSTCAWTVDMPDNQGTKLEFSFLDTAEEGDFVQIYDQGTGNSLGIFYGTDTPETLYTSADGAYIIFKSNMLNTAGFGFEIECSPHTIGIIELTSTTLDIYPNPCKDYINMDIKTNKPQHIDYEIVETTGSIVDKGSFITNSEKYTKLINIPTISAGIYFIRIKTSEDVITKKFIVE